MTRLQRLGMSFLSAITADFAVGAVLCLWDGSTLYGEHLFAFMSFSVFLVFAGWLLSLPVVLLHGALPGIRLYRFAIIGFLIGPLTILAVDLIFAIITSRSTVALEWVVKYSSLAALVSALTTAFYILAFKRAQHESNQPLS